MTVTREPPHHIDDLRQQLRSLGYLDAGVDRFVLGAARGTRGPFAVAALASLRIGILAAVLLGPATAIGVSSRVPGLITGPSDAFVVAAYLAVFFGVAAFGVAFAANLIVSSVAGRLATPGRRRTVPLLAGIVMTVACLAYLALWWDTSTVSTQPAGRTVLWTLLALALAAGIRVLLGHTVTVAALAVLVAKTGTAGASYGIPGSSRRVLLAAAVLTFAGGVLLFSIAGGAGPARGTAPTLTVVPTGLRVRLIAIDGFDPEVVRRLGTDGSLPSFTAALESATAVVTMEDTRDPARLWTTVATGQPPDLHGVHGLETRRLAGLQGSLPASSRARALDGVTDLLRLTAPGVVSGSERRVKTLWEVASSAGLRTAVVNWWATWPAPADAGVILTDRAPLRLEHGGNLDAEIAPPEVYETLRSRWTELRRDATARGRALTNTREVQGIMRGSAELDALQLAIAREVTAVNQDLVCTYVAGLDVAQYALLNAPEGAPFGPSALARRLEVVEGYYRFLDGLLADVLRPAAGEMVIVVTSPGRLAAGPTGVILVGGGPANPRVRDAAARAIDVMPTILHALGVPISQELKGRPIVELFSVDFARKYPVRTVSTYGRPYAKPSPRSGQPLDQEMIDRLRSLGYVK